MIPRMTPTDFQRQLHRINPHRAVSPRILRRAHHTRRRNDSLGLVANAVTITVTPGPLHRHRCPSTEQLQGFSWASVAASAIAAPIANSINDKLFGCVNNTP